MGVPFRGGIMAGGESSRGLVYSVGLAGWLAVCLSVWLAG